MKREPEAALEMRDQGLRSEQRVELKILHDHFTERFRNSECD